MTTVVGLDLSLTSSGIAIVSGDTQFEPRTWAVTSKPAPIAKRTVNVQARRIADIVGDIESYVSFYRPALAVVESPVPNRRMKSALLLERGAVYWGVLGMLDRIGIDIVSCAPTQRALYATGDGSADKVSVARSTFLEHAIEFDTDDELDAYVMANIGCRILGIPRDVAAKHRDTVIDNLSTQRERSE